MSKVKPMPKEQLVQAMKDLEYQLGSMHEDHCEAKKKEDCRCLKQSTYVGFSLLATLSAVIEAGDYEIGGLGDVLPCDPSEIGVGDKWRALVDPLREALGGGE